MTATRSTMRPRLAGISAFAVLLFAALAIVWRTTRTPPAPDSAGGMSAADHAAMTAGGHADAPRAVEIPATDARRIGMTFAAVATTPATREVRVVAAVAVDETRQSIVALKLDGWVERLWIDYTGRSVQRGEPMLEIYAPMLVSAQEELLLAHRLAGSLQAGALQAGSLQGNRPTPKVTDGTDGTDATNGANSLLQSARRRLRSWDIPEATIRRVEESGVVERTVTLVAPSNGVVTEKSVVAGQQVTAGQVLFRLADLSTVWLEGEVFEQDLPFVRLGQVVDAEFTTLPGERRSGRVSYVYPTLDPATRTARVRVTMPNENRTLKPGMSAMLRLHAPGRVMVLSVPRSAVLVTGERSLVFVKRADGKLEPREVTLGYASDDRVEVLRGLAAKDTVVASATFLVDAESNLSTAVAGMASMPGMAGMPEMPDMPGMTAAPGTGAKQKGAGAAKSGTRPRR